MPLPVFILELWLFTLSLFLRISKKKKKKIEHKLTTGPGSPRSPLAPLIPGPPCLTQTHCRVGTQSTHYWVQRGCSYHQHLSGVTRSQVESSECNRQTFIKLTSSEKEEEEEEGTTWSWMDLTLSVHWTCNFLSIHFVYFLLTISSSVQFHHLRMIHCDRVSMFSHVCMRTLLLQTKSASGYSYSNLNLCMQNIHMKTDLRDEGALVPLPHGLPHQGVSQLFHLLVVIQPLHLSLQVTWKQRGIVSMRGA